MNRFLQIIVISLAWAPRSFAIPPTRVDGLYVNTAGRATDPALIFVHGGPGFDSSSFEVSALQALADRGHFVVTYDQRGQGRSALPVRTPDAFRYSKYADDLKSIIDHFKLATPVLLAHSHGGTIAAEFDRKFPNVAAAVILLDAPIDIWQTIVSIHDACHRRYARAHDKSASENLDRQFEFLSKRPNDLAAARAVFKAGLSCGAPAGLYRPLRPDKAAKKIFAAVNDARLKILTEIPEHTADEAFAGFLRNENLLRMDVTKFVTARADHYYGIYGAEDGLFDAKALDGIRKALDGKIKSDSKMQFIKGAGHSIFLDQQEMFVESVMRALQDCRARQLCVLAKPAH